MPNMGYCRFRNTRNDLRECLETLEEGKKLDSEEFEALKDMIEICKGIVEFEDDLESFKEDDEED